MPLLGILSEKEKHLQRDCLHPLFIYYQRRQKVVVPYPNCQKNNYGEGDRIENRKYNLSKQLKLAAAVNDSRFIQLFRHALYKAMIEKKGKAGSKAEIHKDEPQSIEKSDFTHNGNQW